MSLQSLMPTLALVPLSLAPVLQNRAGLAYAVGAMLFGSAFFYYGARLAVQGTNAAARRLLDGARAGSLAEGAAYRRSADAYNDKVKVMNQAIQALRAKAPASAW